MKRKVSVVLVLLLLVAIVPWSAMASLNIPDDPRLHQNPKNGVKIVMTPEEYKQHKAQNNLPDFPIEVKEEWTPPKNAVLSEDPLNESAFVKKLVEEYGPDLKKEVKIDENRSIVYRIENLKYYKIPNSSEEKLTFFDKAGDCLSTKTALASTWPAPCTDRTGIIDYNKIAEYTNGGSVEVKSYMKLLIYEYGREGTIYTFYQHPEFTRGWFWRTSSDYTIKDMEFLFRVLGATTCDEDTIGPDDRMVAKFTPSWASTNQTYTYIFYGEQPYYTSWKPLRKSSDGSVVHRMYGKIYHRNTYIQTLMNTHSNY